MAESPVGQPRQSPLFGYCGCALLASLALAVLAPPFVAPHKTPEVVSCLVNVKQSSMALLLYAGDYDGCLPQKNWADTSASFVKSGKDVYTCPTVKSQNKLYGYAFESALFGKRKTDPANPNKLPLIYETDLLKKNAFAQFRVGLAKPGRHKEKNTVGFLDGHASIVDDTKVTEYVVDYQEKTPPSPKGTK